MQPFLRNPDMLSGTKQLRPECDNLFTGLNPAFDVCVFCTESNYFDRLE
jgi:hypothetical protein